MKVREATLADLDAEIKVLQERLKLVQAELEEAEAARHLITLGFKIVKKEPTNV